MLFLSCFSNLRAGATKGPFPAAFSSSCIHQVLSNSATLRTHAGPCSHRCSSACCKWDSEVLDSQRHHETKRACFCVSWTRCIWVRNLPWVMLDWRSLNNRKFKKCSTCWSILVKRSRFRQNHSSQHCISSSVPWMVRKRVLLSRGNFRYSAQEGELHLCVEKNWNCFQSSFYKYCPKNFISLRCILMVDLDSASEMTEECLAVVRRCSHPPALQTLELLVSEDCFTRLPLNSSTPH